MFVARDIRKYEMGKSSSEEGNPKATFPIEHDYEILSKKNNPPFGGLFSMISIEFINIF